MPTQKKIDSQFSDKQKSGITTFKLFYDCGSRRDKKKEWKRE